MTLYQNEASRQQGVYGFGLRVVGAKCQMPPSPAAAAGAVEQVARVLWIAPGGPAQRAGIKVGDRVST